MSKGKKRSGARPGRPQPLRGTKGKRKGARLWYVGVNNFNCRGFGPLLEDKLCLIFKLAPSVCRMTFPILASLLVRLVVLLPFQLLSHSTRNKTRDGLIRVRNIRALNGRFNTSITHAYSIVIGSKHITLNATGGGFLTASKQFRHGATSKSRSNTASNSTKHKSPHLSGWRQIISLIT